MYQRARDKGDGFQIGGAEPFLVDYDKAFDINTALHDVVHVCVYE